MLCVFRQPNSERLRSLAARWRGRVLSRENHTLIEAVSDDKLTYLSKRRLINLAIQCQDMENQQIPGLFIEAGCALGGSAIISAKLKSTRRPLLLYDVFAQIPAPSEQDPEAAHERYANISSGRSTGIGGNPYYGYQDNLMDVVRGNLERYGVDCHADRVALVQGRVEDTLRGRERVALAHIDVDWYDPVRVCLERLYPRLMPGGRLILDDYHDWGGCKKATDEFLQTLGNDVEVDCWTGPLTITKLAV